MGVWSVGALKTAQIGQWNGWTVEVGCPWWSKKTRGARKTENKIANQDMHTFLKLT